ncbi:MAG: TadE family protein [Candidatus Sulfotelmatobacter sp.]
MSGFSSIAASSRSLRKSDAGSQIVEFALSVPVLVLFVIGIFDFSGALALKHKLENAVREGARVAAADPATDLNASMPVSVSDAYQAVDNYLVSEQVNDCGLASAAAPTGASLQWIYTANASCPGASGLTLTINRGCAQPQSVTMGANSPTIYLICTQVTLVYPYVWQFTGAVGLFGRIVGPASITTSAVAFDEN